MPSLQTVSNADLKSTKQTNKYLRFAEFATVIWRLHTVLQSRSMVTSAENLNPTPDNSPQSIGELRNGHVANLQELCYTRLVRKMAWYKILIHVLIV